jgi:hypothetical protein
MANKVHSAKPGFAPRFARSGAYGTGSWTDTSPPNGCRTATKVPVWELAENPAACEKPLYWSAAQQLLVPVWELVEFIGVNSMPSLRTKSISTKVTDEEYAQFEAIAGEQTISEWARDVLLKATKPNAAEQTVLAEVLALRTILLNIHFAVSQGRTLTAEEMQQLMERADQNKLSKARQRLAEAATGGVP